MAENYKDPVCGMQVTPGTAADKLEYKGQTYYFCSADDRKLFEKNPEIYLKQKKETAR